MSVAAAFSGSGVVIASMPATVGKQLVVSSIPATVGKQSIVLMSISAGSYQLIGVIRMPAVG